MSYTNTSTLSPSPATDQITVTNVTRKPSPDEPGTELVSFALCSAGREIAELWDISFPAGTTVEEIAEWANNGACSEAAA